MSDFAYVFGYASLVGADKRLIVDGREYRSVGGRLRGYRRHWGVAMNNWEGSDAVKHFLDPESGERPRIRVAYLDLYEQPGGAVNGLALPVDPARLAALDAREVNYERVDVTAAFEPEGALPPSVGGSYGGYQVFTYLGLAAAHERCRQGAADGNVFVRRGYVRDVRDAFASLAPDALHEFDRTTDPLPFPERNLRVVPRGRAAT